MPDDILLIAKADLDQANTIQSILGKFSSLSGLTVNFQKSKVMFSANTSQDLASQISYKLSVSQSNQFGKYLGFPIYSKIKKASGYQDILKNIEAN